jgi:hypothetical protein
MMTAKQAAALTFTAEGEFLVTPWVNLRRDRKVRARITAEAVDAGRHVIYADGVQPDCGGCRSTLDEAKAGAIEWMIKQEAIRSPQTLADLTEADSAYNSLAYSYAVEQFGHDGASNWVAGDKTLLAKARRLGCILMPQEAIEWAETQEEPAPAPAQAA